MNEPQLFDPSRTTTTQCQVCHMTRRPGEEKVPTCPVDHDRERYPQRPAKCLNHIQPEFQDIPY